MHPPSDPIDVLLSPIEILTYGRKGPSAPAGRRAQLEQIGRTVRNTPEVMVKVSGGGTTTSHVRSHLAYISRHGKVDLITDEGEKLCGHGVAGRVVNDWDLDLSRGQGRLKQAFNLVLSMPAGTPEDKLLAAAQKFAREKFALQHRYAMALHTDHAHPHVHLVVKAEDHNGKRLYIRKATLRQWRQDFAGYLRELGIAANASPALVRGGLRERKRDPIYRATKRGRSTFMRAKVEAAAREIQAGSSAPEPGKAQVVERRRQITGAWRSVATELRAQGAPRLAGEIDQFVHSLPPLMTERERLRAGLLAQIAARRSKGEAKGEGEPEPPHR